MVLAVTDPAKFSVAQIGVTSVVTGLLSLPIALWLLRPRSLALAVGVALVAALATFGWRLCANMPDLNNDGVPGYSANDLAAPMFTYVLLGVLAAVKPPVDALRYARSRALVVAVALAVNVITI